MMIIFQKYCEIAKTKPMRTSVITGGVVSALGDITSQKFLEKRGEKKENLDIRRVTSMFTFATIYSGFQTMLWMRLYPSFFAHLGRLASCAGKTTVEQAIVFPFIYLPTFYVSVSYLRGWSFIESFELLKSKWWITLVTAWSFFPFIQFFSFYYFPPHLLVPFSVFIGYLWNTAIACIANENQK
eukprot:GHVL01027768.1.p1 GENE.GHVL01027768.1~~GHVL01027768.1.p1  ORF type:complete len:184 (+),score=12.93 GHVL01027768.1:47-598(+)